VGLLTNWKQVSAGGTYTACIKTDGTLWTWGGNTDGQLGLGNAAAISSPVQMGTLTNWKQVSANDDDHTFAILDSTF
jgi:alpha-tubulin suppressor-like RCC1 family protein